MSYGIYITQTAERDMYEAADYIEFVLKNPDAAERLIDDAEEKIKSLAEFPYRINLVNDTFLAAFDIRLIEEKNYLVFFIVSDEEQKITVIRFLYAKRDWITILKLGYETGSINENHTNI